jgi:hypothetical protein
VLGIIQCVRDTGALFTLNEEEWLIDFTQHVAMAAMHTLHQNSGAYKVFGTVDTLCLSLECVLLLARMCPLTR